MLRQVAAALEVDTATISKIERGDRQAKEEHLPLLAKLLGTNLEDLKTLWLAEKVYHIIKEEKNALEVLNTVIEYNKTNA